VSYTDHLYSFQYTWRLHELIWQEGSTSLLQATSPPPTIQTGPHWSEKDNLETPKIPPGPHSNA